MKKRNLQSLLGPSGNNIGPLPANPENLRIARSFLLEKWRERASESGVNTGEIPCDLSGSCKFSALFAQTIFGGEIRANPFHTFVRLNGEILDLNHDAEDIRSLAAPYSHWRSFSRSRDFKDSLDSCRPRVARWAEEFHDLLRLT